MNKLETTKGDAVDSRSAIHKVNSTISYTYYSIYHRSCNRVRSGWD